MVNDENGIPASVSRVPPNTPSRRQAVLGGDFSQYRTTANGSVVPIYDPATGNPDGTGRTQFPGNVIPASRIDPISLKFIQLFYAPAQNSQFQNNYTYLQSQRDTHDGFNVRGDYYLSSKQQFAFRFSNGLETNPPATIPDGGRDNRQQYHHRATTSTWAPHHLDPLSHDRQRSHVDLWLTNTYNSLGLYSQRASITPWASSGFPTFNRVFLQLGAFPPLAFRGISTAGWATAPTVRM